MEKIIHISLEVFTIDKKTNTYDGVIITTDKQVIKIGIRDYQQCCENSGFLSTEDNLLDFIGAELLGINRVDGDYNVLKLALRDSYCSDNAYTYCSENAYAIFINVETNKGTLQFVCYNIHNGYYGHDVVIRSAELSFDETI